MNRKEKLDYLKRIVLSYLIEIKKHIELSKNEMERSYYQSKYYAQLTDFARALNVREKDLDKFIESKKGKWN